jgi:O-antigen ligase
MFSDSRPKFFLGLLLLFIFAIPISQFISVRLLVIFLLSSFFFNKNTRNEFFLVLTKAWDILLYLVVLLIGFLYTTELDSGLGVIETSFSLFAIPLIFGVVRPFEENKFHELLLSFIAGLTFACLFCVIHSTISFYQTGSVASFFFGQLTEALDFQPTYFAYYLCFAISVILYFIHYEKINYPIWISILLASFFFLMLMLTAGRTAYIAMLLVFSFFILKFLFEEGRTFNTNLTFGISSVLLICMLLINYFDVNAGLNTLGENNDYWERITLWESAIKATPDFLFGAGTGDYKAVLNDYFNAHSLSEYAKSSLNPHNQFIQSFLSNGLLGLISLLLLLGRPLYLSVKHQNVLGIMTFFSFFIYGMTEVFLGRYQGVVFFAFLHQCFISYYNCKDNLSLKKT